MHCYESVDGLPLAAVTVRRFKLLLKRIWVKVMFYNVLSHMHYFQASSVLHWFLVKCLIASWMQYNSVLFANMVYISKWYTALTVKTQDFLRILKYVSVCVFAHPCTHLCVAGSSFLGVTYEIWVGCSVLGVASSPRVYVASVGRGFYICVCVYIFFLYTYAYIYK